MKRIGPQMQRALDIVTDNPGMVMYQVAKMLHVGARSGKNNALGYNPIHRALKAGLIIKRPGSGNANILFPVSK